MLGNWQIDGIATLESGRPYTVEDAGDIANTGNFNFVGPGYERPNQVGNPKPATVKHRASGLIPPPLLLRTQYTFGDTPRNSLRTEPYKSLDASLFREFPLSESIKLQLRLDAFNSFNHPVWGVPNSCQNCQNFGVSHSALRSTAPVKCKCRVNSFSRYMPESSNRDRHHWARFHSQLFLLASANRLCSSTSETVTGSKSFSCEVRSLQVVLHRYCLLAA